MTSDDSLKQIYSTPDSGHVENAERGKAFKLAALGVTALVGFSMAAAFVTSPVWSPLLAAAGVVSATYCVGRTFLTASKKPYTLEA